MVPIFHGIVSGGGIKLDKVDKFKIYLSALEGKRIEITVQTLKKVRSLAENRYYFGVIVKMVADEMTVTPDDAHEYLKSLFLKKGIEHRGKRYEITRSTASLTVQAFEEYCERCRQWAANELNCVIPLPNEVAMDEF